MTEANPSPSGLEERREKIARIIEEACLLAKTGGTRVVERATDVILSLPPQGLDRVKAALELAVGLLLEQEPPDARAVRQEVVALASVVAGHDNDECWSSIREALSLLRGGEDG